MTDPVRRARRLRRVAARAFWRRLWRVVRRWVERSRRRRELAGLDDHMLRDIGATRYDVTMEISKPFWRE